jgi:hypothetical protein
VEVVLGGPAGGQPRHPVHGLRDRDHPRAVERRHREWSMPDRSDAVRGPAQPRSSPTRRTPRWSPR